MKDCAFERPKMRGAGGARASAGNLKNKTTAQMKPRLKKILDRQ